MRSCKQIQNDFVEALYGELDDHRQRSLQAHLKSCAECRREFESLRQTLELMSRRQRPLHPKQSAEADDAGRQERDGSRSQEEAGRPPRSSIESLQERILRAAESQGGAGAEIQRPQSFRERRTQQPVDGAVQRSAMASESRDWSGSSAPQLQSKSRSNWRFLMQMAAGIALIALGVVIGRVTMDSSYSPSGQPADLAQGSDVQPGLAPDSGTADAGDPASASAQELARRVGGYVSSSQALLVGLANLDIEADGIESFNLDPQRQLSRRLLKEASYLRGNLDGQESREAVELISDLESILRQIANLEARHDLEGIEVIQQGVESSGILIKIQLQKIRPNPLVPEKDRKKKEAA